MKKSKNRPQKVTTGSYLSLPPKMRGPPKYAKIEKNDEK